MNDQQIITRKEIEELDVVPVDSLDDAVKKANDRVDELIGTEVITSLTPEDIEELADLQESSKSTDEIGDWIAERVPDYAEIIEDARNLALGDLVDEYDKEEE